MMESCSRFTAAEGGARLAAAASTRNILVTEYTAFIPMNLLIEHAYKIRGTLSDGMQRSVYLTRPSRIECVAHEYNILTSLKVCKANKYSDVKNWSEEVEVKELLVCTSEVLNQILEEGILRISNINVLIIDSCHLIFPDQNLQNIMKHYKECELEKPRILALTYPLFTAPKDEEKGNTSIDKSNDETEDSKDKESKDAETADKEIEKDNTDKEKSTKTKTNEIGVYQNMDDFDMYEKLEWKIEELEKALCCKMDLAEDIDAGKRLAVTIAKPKEILIEYKPPLLVDDQPVTYQELDAFMRNTIKDASDFIDEHRYDPTEIYGEDLYEEFINIPDPTIEPKQIFKEFIYILDQLGPYAADKAAFTLLIKLEKLKIKVPYERHFLLLCLCTSVFVKIRSYTDCVFSKYETDWDKISTFSTPKVLRFAEILEQFKPTDDKNNIYSNKSNHNVNNLKEADVDNSQESNTVNNVNSNNVNGGNVKANVEDVNNDKGNNVNNNDNNIKISNDNKPTNENTINEETELEIENNGKSNSKDTNKSISENNDERDVKSKLESVDDGTIKVGDVNDVINSTVKRSKTSDLLNVIDSCDFTTLGNKIEDRVNTYAANLKDLDDESVTNAANDNIPESLHSKDTRSEKNEDKFNEPKSAKLESQDITENDKPTIDSQNDIPNDLEKCDNKIDSQKGFGKRSNRTRGRSRAQRSNVAKLRQMQQNPDALCGIVFMKEALIAKIMFMIIVDMSRSRHALSQLCAQYCASEPNTSAEARESQRQGRKQEDVLKKFRMHECNLLLATPDLEEGIDLPRCNLVVRWDVPPSYKSHGLCRGRARAPRSSVTLLANVEVDSKELIHNLAVYKELDQIITRKCGCGVQNEPPQEEENHADEVAHLIKPYTPAIVDKEMKNHPTDKKNETKDVNSEDSISENSEIKIEIRNDDITKELMFDTTKDEFKEIQPPDPNNVVSNDIPLVNNDEMNSEITNIDNGSGLNEFKEIKYDLCNGNKNEKTGDIASVDLSTAIALINRYCGKLPSDTFTRLAPQWWMERVTLPDRCGRERTAYVCTLRMPLNCPVKYNIVGHPMPTRVLARRMVALQACRILHKSGELDNQLMPIGKENFKAAELDNDNNDLDDNDSARPGTTKRRQYYYKRTAWAFTDCQPIIDCTDKEIEDNPTPTPDDLSKSRNTAWALAARLWCALPERYNTRGRRLHAPQNARQALGLMLSKRDHRQLQIPAFPVYTRSGEVRVSVEPAAEADVRLSPRRAKLIRRFMRFVFADVLRVRRRGMRLHADAAPHNNYYVVPTTKRTKGDGTTVVDIDWEFLELIYNHTEEQKSQEVDKPVLWEDGETKEKEKKEKDKEVKKIENPLLKPGVVFEFDADKYKDAVVTPWYRNQDQPQFFLVAEICWNLSPESEFPSTQHGSFRTYYRSKYGAELTQPAQPLLDVDHTSARLNLLTPRYVNRKGVALPVSSERTRRNKRDRLDQKQILVPELCRRHPFAAPLWFATVALPCVLYRINALLIADEIRRAVAIDVGLGIPRIDDSTCPGFQWPPLDFGWSLAEVLNTDEKPDKNNDDDELKVDKEEKNSAIENQDDDDCKQIEDKDEGEVKEKTINDILQEKEEAESGFEIGTWSNEMASTIPDTVEFDEYLEPLPSNLTFCTSASGGANWSDTVDKPRNQFNPTRAYSVADSDYSYMSSDFDTDSEFNTDGSDEDTDTSGFNGKNAFAMGVRIEYKTAHEAEAVDIEKRKPVAPAPLPDAADDANDVALFKTVLREGTPPDEHIKKFRNSVAQHKKDIAENNLIATDEPIKDLLPEVPSNEKQKVNKDKISDKVTKICHKASENGEKQKADKDNISQKETKIYHTASENDEKQEADMDKICEKAITIYHKASENDEKQKVDKNKMCEEAITIYHKASENDEKQKVDKDKICEKETKTYHKANKSDGKHKEDKDKICEKETTIYHKTGENDEKQKADKDKICEKETTIYHKANENDEKQKVDKDKINETETKTYHKAGENDEKQKADKDKISEMGTKIYHKASEIDEKQKAKRSNKIETANKVDETTVNEEDSNKELITGDSSKKSDKILEEIFPYKGINVYENISLEEIEKNKRILLDELKKSLPEDEIKKMNCFSMKDINIDSPDYVNEKVENVGFDSNEKYQEMVNSWKDQYEYKPYYMDGKGQNGKEFDFDFQPDLDGHPGPSPSVILQALTMSNANDGINLERLETIGDSFLKFAITAYLYCAHPAVHEGKLSHMRSKQVSNLNLYRLGRNKRLGARMIASKFEPHDNWLPPCHRPPPTLHATAEPKDSAATADAPHDSSGCFIPYNLITQHSIPDKSIADCVEALIGAYLLECGPRGALLFMSWLGIRVLPQHVLPLPPHHPHVLRDIQRQRTADTQPSAQQAPTSATPEVPEASDSEWSSDGGGGGEAGGEGELPHDWSWPGRAVGSLRPYRDASGRWVQPIFGALKAPPSPLLRYIDNPEGELEQMLSGYEALEAVLRYRFRDRALLLQALTHASHAPNRLTDCYQRLEFLGDAILDYLITRHLFCDGRRHSPGALTDLRSALVNNTIFATLAARHGFHKYFRHMSPGLHEVLTKYVRIQEENGHSISEEHYLIQEDELEQAEDVEVPKALGDLFESVAGAIFLDSGMSLGAVWRSYGALMGAELEAFSAAAPKSPVRELLEAEPDTAKFGKPERLADGRRVRVCVEVFGRGAFKGVGRNYRIAKGTAARCALRHLKRRH